MKKITSILSIEKLTTPLNSQNLNYGRAYFDFVIVDELGYDSQYNDSIKEIAPTECSITF